MPKSAQFLRSVAICLAAIWSTMLRRPSMVVGTLWSTVAMVAIGAAHLAAGEAQTLKGLRRSDLVEQLQVDVEQGGLALGLDHDVLLPDFFK